jgi:hypothetical protein
MRPAQQGLSKEAGLISETFFLFSTTNIILVFPNLSILCPQLIFLVYSWLYTTQVSYGTHLQPAASVQFQMFVLPVSKRSIVTPVYLTPTVII